MYAIALFDCQLIIVEDKQSFTSALMLWVCRYYQQMQGMILILYVCCSRQLTMSYLNFLYELKLTLQKDDSGFLFAIRSFLRKLSLLTLYCNRSSHNICIIALSDIKDIRDR